MRSRTYPGYKLAKAYGRKVTNPRGMELTADVIDVWSNCFLHVSVSISRLVLLSMEEKLLFGVERVNTETLNWRKRCE